MQTSFSLRMNSSISFEDGNNKGYGFSYFEKFHVNSGVSNFLETENNDFIALQLL